MRETPESVLRIVDVHKRYGDKVVHGGIDLDVKQGEILCLMGGSGSGKSVLLRALIGLEKIDKGHIYYRDQELTHLKEDDLVPIRKKVAYVFQYGALFDSFTIKENLAYPLREHTKLSDAEISKRVSATLAKVGLEKTEHLFPSDLSGGMQRRVGVARSIIMEPEVILYDEPTTGLDPYNTQQILNIILQLKKQGATSVLVTHDMHSVFTVADRVAFLQKGTIRAIGPVDEFKNSTDPAIRGYISGDRP